MSKKRIESICPLCKGRGRTRRDGVASHLIWAAFIIGLGVLPIIYATHWKDRFEQGLATDDRQAQVATIRLARLLPPSSAGCGTRLADLMLDRDDDVSAAAHEAFWARDRRQQAEILVDVIRRESFGPRKWMLIDAVLASGDIGTKGEQEWPPWAVEMAEGLPYLARRYIADKIRHLRDRLRG